MIKKIMWSIFLGILFGLGVLAAYRVAIYCVDTIQWIVNGEDVGKASEIITGILQDSRAPMVFLIGAIPGVVIGIIRTIQKKISGYYDEGRNFSYSKKGTFGTSTFMTNEEFDRELRATKLNDSDELIFGMMEQG